MRSTPPNITKQSRRETLRHQFSSSRLNIYAQRLSVRSCYLDTTLFRTTLGRVGACEIVVIGPSRPSNSLASCGIHEWGVFTPPFTNLDTMQASSGPSISLEIQFRVARSGRKGRASILPHCVYCVGFTRYFPSGH